MYYRLRFDHDTSTSRTHTFCQFCGVYGINDLESRLKVIWGRWFSQQSTTHTWLPIGLQ